MANHSLNEGTMTQTVYSVEKHTPFNKYGIYPVAFCLLLVILSALRIITCNFC